MQKVRGLWSENAVKGKKCVAAKYIAKSLQLTRPVSKHGGRSVPRLLYLARRVTVRLLKRLVFGGHRDCSLYPPPLATMINRLFVLPRA